MSSPFKGFELIANHFPNVKITGTTARAWCPVHQGDGHSSRQNRTLMMRTMPDGSIQILCNGGCVHREVLAAVGLRWLDTIPDHMRRDYGQATLCKPKFEGWPCLQVLDALLVDIHKVRIFGGKILDQRPKIEHLMPFERSDWDQLRAAHHRIGEAVTRVSREVRHG